MKRHLAGLACGLLCAVVLPVLIVMFAVVIIAIAFVMPAVGLLHPAFFLDRDKEKRELKEVVDA